MGTTQRPRGVRRLAVATLLCCALVALSDTASAEKDRADPISVRKGLPKAKGLGTMVIATNFATRDARYKVIKAYAKARGAKLQRFKDAELDSLVKPLRKVGPEFVAFAMTPESIDTNVHYGILELCRDLDDDPMPDFYFGYLTAADGPELEGLLAAIAKRETQAQTEGAPVPTGAVTSLSAGNKSLHTLDYFMHFGHGQAWCVQGGLSGKELSELEFVQAPVVWSGACFNGVFSRSFHKCAYQMIFMTPMTIDPETLMTLAWVRAGASAYFAAMEGDRGEMAMAEWEYFRQHACSVGETMGFQYRLAFASLPASFTKFPRQLNRYKKRMGFYDVMLRGMVSRMVLSDPSFRPLAAPMEEPAQKSSVTHDTETGAVQVRTEAVRWSQGLQLNYLPKSGKGIFDRRLFTRVALPKDVAGEFSDIQVKLTNGPELVEPTRFHVRHEVWGGERFVVLQVEAPAGKIKAGTVALWTLTP